MDTTTPRVLLDATSIPAAKGGVARFIIGLLAGLEATGTRITVVAKRSDLPALSAAAPGHRYIVAPPSVSVRPLRLIWEQVGLPALARRQGCTVIHSPHYTFPLAAGAASVVTLHDATFFSSPEVHSRVKGVFFRRWIRWAAAGATRLVAVSRATADEIARFVPRLASPMAVAYLGVDPVVFSPPTPAAVRAVRKNIGLSIDQPYVAFLGTMEPRKNIPALLEAHATLRAENPADTPVLVLSGARGWDASTNDALDRIAALPVADRSVIEAGYLPLELLSAFLGGAELVAYPSLGEGFGLPVLEAMSSGTAVLTTRRLAIPEVGGEAVAYSEPDAESLTVALRELLADDGRRAALAAYGLARSRQFTWAECARVYADSYASAAAERAR
jgi:glycosyltransferase involved in cell wall biosynthesis